MKLSCLTIQEGVIMTTENTIIIFHRSKQNIEESLTNQQIFLECYNKNFTHPVKIIDYISGDYRQAKEITELISKQSSLKQIIVIINSFLSQKDHELHYDLYNFFHFFKTINMLNLYLMDSGGKLYKELKNIDD